MTPVLYAVQAKANHAARFAMTVCRNATKTEPGAYATLILIVYVMPVKGQRKPVATVEHRKLHVTIMESGNGLNFVQGRVFVQQGKSKHESVALAVERRSAHAQMSVIGAIGQPVRKVYVNLVRKKNKAAEPAGPCSENVHPNVSGVISLSV